jgi:hypothetical protein
VPDRTEQDRSELGHVQPNQAPHLVIVMYKREQENRAKLKLYKHHHFLELYPSSYFFK